MGLFLRIMHGRRSDGLLRPVEQQPSQLAWPTLTTTANEIWHQTNGITHFVAGVGTRHVCGHDAPCLRELAPTSCASAQPDSPLQRPGRAGLRLAMQRLCPAFMTKIWLTPTDGPHRRCYARPLSARHEWESCGRISRGQRLHRLQVAAELGRKRRRRRFAGQWLLVSERAILARIMTERNVTGRRQKGAKAYCASAPATWRLTENSGRHPQSWFNNKSC